MKFISNHVDFWGFIASTVCALHCALVPILLLFGTLGSFAWLASHEVELGFIFFSIILAYWSLWTSFKKYHRDNKPLKIVLVGFFFLLISHLLPHSFGGFLVVFGGLLVAYAHYVNWQMLNR